MVPSLTYSNTKYVLIQISLPTFSSFSLLSLFSLMELYKKEISHILKYELCSLEDVAVNRKCGIHPQLLTPFLHRDQLTELCLMVISQPSQNHILYYSLITKVNR